MADDVRRLLRVTLSPVHSVVSLGDAEAPDSFPSWSPEEIDPVTGAFSSDVCVGARGLSVLVEDVADVEADVRAGPHLSPETLVGAGVITVGGQGLLLSDMVGFDRVPWPPGRLKVEVHRVESHARPPALLFVLTPLDGAAGA